MRSPKAATLGTLIYARMMNDLAIAQYGESYALADARSLIDDAISQVRGDMAAEQGEYPIRGVAP